VKRHLLLFLLLLKSSTFVQSQELLEGIAAQVDRELVFLSEVEERAYLYRIQNTKIPGPPTELDRRKALDELINERILRVYARANQIQASEREVSDAVDRAINDVRSSFSSEEDFQKALESEGLTEPTLRQNYKKEISDKLVRDRVIAREIYDQVEVSRKEVQDYYRTHRDQLGRTDRVFDVRQLVIPLPLVPAEEDPARRLLRELHDRISGPEEFATAAREYSDDVGTKARGGDLGWVEEGALVEEIRRIVSVLQPGQMSAVSVTRFGLHLFYVDNREGETVRLYHILKKVRRDTTRADAIGREIQSAIDDFSAGRASWSELIARFPQRDVTKSGEFEYAEDEVPSRIQEWASMAKPGDVSDVIEEETSFLVVLVEGIKGGKVRSLGSLYPRIEEELRVAKLDEKFNEWITERRQQVFVQILSPSLGIKK
jgi:peptidyl-prolyl cis-trans isomerase SurA